MGLIKAAQAATGTVMADQWKEFFYCDSLDNDTLLVRGKKRTGSRSSNTSGNDNIISNGSGIAVADGQCMLIVDQGKIAEVCAEPGEYTYDTSSEPSIFAGNLSDSIKNTFLTIGKDSVMAVIQEKIRESTISTQRKSQITSLELRIRSGSVW